MVSRIAGAACCHTCSNSDTRWANILPVTGSTTTRAAWMVALDRASSTDTVSATAAMATSVRMARCDSAARGSADRANAMARPSQARTGTWMRSLTSPVSSRPRRRGVRRVM